MWLEAVANKKNDSIRSAQSHHSNIFGKSSHTQLFLHGAKTEKQLRHAKHEPSRWQTNPTPVVAGGATLPGEGHCGTMPQEHWLL